MFPCLNLCLFKGPENFWNMRIRENYWNMQHVGNTSCIAREYRLRGTSCGVRGVHMVQRGVHVVAWGVHVASSEHMLVLFGCTCYFRLVAQISSCWRHMLVLIESTTCARKKVR